MRVIVMNYGLWLSINFFQHKDDNIDIPRINKYKGDKESDREKGINWRLSQITAEMFTG